MVWKGTPPVCPGRGRFTAVYSITEPVVPWARVNSASASPAAQSSAAAARPITKLIVVAQITRTYLPAVSRQ